MFVNSNTVSWRISIQFYDNLSGLTFPNAITIFFFASKLMLCLTGSSCVSHSGENRHSAEEESHVNGSLSGRRTVEQAEPLKSGQNCEAESEQDGPSATPPGVGFSHRLVMKHTFNGLGDWS